MKNTSKKFDVLKLEKRKKFLKGGSRWTQGAGAARVFTPKTGGACSRGLSGFAALSASRVLHGRAEGHFLTA